MSMFKAEHSAPEQVTLDQVPTLAAHVGCAPPPPPLLLLQNQVQSQVPRGRKRLVAPAASQSAAKAREAQRRLRDKKAQLVANLERENVLLRSRVKELEETIRQMSIVLTVASPSASSTLHSNDPPASNQSEKTMPYLPIQSPAFSQATVPFDDATATEESDLDWVDVKDAANSTSMRRKSPVDRYGPVQTESARAALFSLASVQNSPSAQTNVNQLLDLFAAQATCTDKRTIKKYLVAITAARFRILDECTLLDRQQFILHLDNFIQLNAKHCKNLYKIFRDPKYHRSSTPPSFPTFPFPYDPSNPRIRPFRDALTAIPSFASAGDLIDELCSLYWSFTFKGDHEDKLLRMVLLVRKMEKLCEGRSEDRIRFLVATEIGRESNRNHMDELLKEVQEIL